MEEFENVTGYMVRRYCVYMLMHNDKIVYIGRSKHLFKRFWQHKAEKRITFDQCLARWCWTLRESAQLEIELIRHYQPVYNRMCTDHYNPADLGDLMGKHVDLLALGLIKQPPPRPAWRRL